MVFLFYEDEILEVPAGRDTGILPSFESRFQHIRDARANSYLGASPARAGAPAALFGGVRVRKGRRLGRCQL